MPAWTAVRVVIVRGRSEAETTETLAERDLSTPAQLRSAPIAIPVSRSDSA